MRLQKVLANHGLGSRRTIESWIKTGKVQVNGKDAIIGQKISPQDKIKVDGKIVSLEDNVAKLPRVLMYHKPEGEICSRVTENGKKSVFESLPLVDGRWVMVGRLDVNTAGLLLFTNQGELAHRLMHPRFEVLRQYAVRVYGTVSDEALSNMRKGIELSTGISRFKEISRKPSSDGRNQWFTVSLSQGKYREVRELFASQNYTVSRLIRIKYGHLTLPRELKKGKWLELSAAQILDLQK
ncbi:MAG: pseudouridine synthase [Proteobacteria bacterium]|nr:pseudouridine synthase [Pseudomonadota bacterium]